ncbi:DUF5985 family protein [Piscinibacter gummiphilus]|uniref:DUF5985 family protein n=1 Tax=Piscinibacter gummiphilus TaxID=946333 RepID=A0ABZ0CLR7_9BURK|nr:DUF5985 family protein [Piscinibacter gummiphilus]WOB05928.1 DUF5985 family protein [Piscinibacter gummiphilus]
MAEIAYAACAITAGLCAWLLLRAFMRSRFRLLLWGGLCFVGLTLNSVLLIFDKMVFPALDLSVFRLSMGLVALLVLLTGLILDGDA